DLRLVGGEVVGCEDAAACLDLPLDRFGHPPAVEAGSSVARDLAQRLRECRGVDSLVRPVRHATVFGQLRWSAVAEKERRGVGQRLDLLQSRDDGQYE